MELVGETRWRQLLAAEEKELSRLYSLCCYSILSLHSTFPWRSHMRRYFWAFLCWMLLAGSISTSNESRAEEKRPNILFAFADDWGRFAGAYAKIDGPGTINDVVATPHFDRIAKEGVLFRLRVARHVAAHFFQDNTFGVPVVRRFFAARFGTACNLHIRYY